MVAHADNGVGENGGAMEASGRQVTVRRMKEVAHMALPDGGHFVALSVKACVSSAAAEAYRLLCQSGRGATSTNTFKHLMQSRRKSAAGSVKVASSSMNRFLYELKKRNEEHTFRQLVALNQKVLPAALAPELQVTCGG